MATTITPIKRAVIMLDQSSGELREEDGKLLGLDLWPETQAAFSATGAQGLQVILAVPTDLNIKAVTGLSGWIDGLTVVPVSPDFAFDRAGDTISSLSKAEPGTAFVSADRRLRGEAVQADLQPAPHVGLLPMMMRGEAPEAVRMVGPKEVLTHLCLSDNVIPMQFQPTDGKAWALIALVAGDIQISSVMKGVMMNPLPYDPMTEDLVWARIDEDSAKARELLAKRKILHAEPGQVLIALAPGEDAQALHVHGAHGHSELLMPSPQLLKPAIRDSLDSDAINLGALPEDIFEPVKKSVIDPKILRILRPACTVVTASYESDLDRYTGISALDANGPIVSRHSAHLDNKRVETQLLNDLNAIGYCAHRHNFTHAGQIHSNIIADLPGAGIFRIRPKILERCRKILRANPLPKPLKPFEREMRELTGSEWFLDAEFRQMTDAELRYRIEQIFRLRPWYPWWKKLCTIVGFGADLVIVGCHLDSTAGFEPEYVASTDPAPGRDDNASGLASVLSMARYMWSLRGKLTHTVRFCFFNAEESGLIGSKAYAAKMKSLGAPIREVICLDMVGHNSDPNRLFEIHAGYTDPAIRDLNLPLTPYVENAAAAYGQLAPAQVYAGTSWSGAPDRSVYDGAINRSDHAAFHQQGYPAILVSEDFFANLASEPDADPNPNYHRATDTFVDLAYARDIVCAVSQAVVRLAR
jgi:hypothetical protein